MPTTYPAYTFGGITRPELIVDDTGHIVLFGASAAFAAAYGTKALYVGLPPGFPVLPPVTDSVSTPVDNNGAGNTVVEGAAVNTAVGITASATSIIGNPVTYSLVGDSSGGGFKINATTGVVTVNDPTKINFETASHTYTVTVQANDGILTSTQSFVIGVSDVAPTTPVDSNGATNTVAEGAAANATVGVTASATDVNGPGVTWSLTADSSNGGFKIDPVTGVVSVADPSKINYEASGAGHSYTITAQASDGTLTSSQTFSIAVTDIPIGNPVDTNAAANGVVEGAANGTVVGITASAVDPNGPPTTYALIGDTSGGGFTINATTGVVTVADSTKIDWETLAFNGRDSYSVTVQATNGATVTTQAFAIAVNDVAPSTPVDSDDADDTVAEGAANGSTVGVTASSTDVNGPGVTWSLTGDTSGGGFTINASTGVVTVANSSKIDFETSGGSYDVTAQASDGTLATSQTFTIAVTNINDAPVNSVPGAQTVPEDTNLVFSAANGNAITISDQDGGPSDETVKLTVDAGTLTLGATANLTSFNNNSDTITLTGSIANINAALNGLTYTGPANGYGEVNFKIVTNDNGNTGPGGAKSDTDTFKITITAVNDAPVFTVGGTQNVLEDSGAHTVNGFITDIAPAPASNEFAQTVDFLVSNNNNVLFSVAPAIDASGNLTYTLAANANGSATVTVKAHDDGGTANGGSDTSGVQTFVINAGPVNDAPAGTDKTISSSGAHTFTAAEFGFTDPVDAGSASGANALQAVIITTLPGAGTGTLTLDTGSGPVAVVAGQTIAVGQIGGLVFTPVGNNIGTFTFQVQDNGGTLNSGVDTDQSANSFTITPNVAPTIDVNGINGHIYFENDPAWQIDPTIAITDPDDTHMESATVAITGGYAGAEDVLLFTNTASIIGTYVGNTLTATGHATLAEYETFLESVQYQNSSNTPSAADRVFSYTVNDGSVDSAAGTALLHFITFNDEPTLTATAVNPGFFENGAAVDLFSSPSVSTVEPGEAVNQIIFTVTNVAGTGATESLTIDGTVVELFNGNSETTATNNQTASVVLAGGTATVTVSGAGMSVSQMATLVDNLAYGNTSQDPGGLSRVVTITSLRDDGAQNVGDDNTNSALAVSSTVTVTPDGFAGNFLFASTPAAAPAPVTPGYLIRGEHFDFSALTAPPANDAGGHFAGTFTTKVVTTVAQAFMIPDGVPFFKIADIHSVDPHFDLHL